jgi:hypothetical protein
MTEVQNPPPEGRPASWVERAGAWLSEEALTGLLLVLIVYEFVVPVVAPGLGEFALNILFTVLLFTGLATVANRRTAFVVAGVFAIAAVVLKWMAPVPDLPGTQLAAAVAAVGTFALFTLLVLIRTFSPGPITRRRIEGAVAVYLLVALTFTFAYEVMELVRPGSLKFAEGEPEIMERAVGYFSLVTLTTVGYGDVTPVTPLARRLAMLEGFIGQLYPAIIIGWMVSSLRPRRPD